MKVGLTARQVAVLAGVSPRTINYVEQGRVPYMDTQVRLAAVLSRELGQDGPTWPRPLGHLDLWPLKPGVHAKRAA